MGVFGDVGAMVKFDLSLLSDDAADQYTWDWMRTRTEPLSVEDYLSFASSDLSDGKTSRHLVNALSNAKKALHLRLEDMCLGFGAGDLKKFKAFPALVGYARDCGLVAPRVLDRINSMRNAVEHEYILPSESDVETFVDVVQLFSAATERWVSRRPCNVGYFGDNPLSSLPEDRLSEIIFDWDKGVAILIFGEAGFHNQSKQEKVKYHSPSPEFFQCVRFALRNSD